jgi:hypothetical protein
MAVSPTRRVRHKDDDTLVGELAVLVDELDLKWQQLQDGS